MLGDIYIQFRIENLDEFESLIKKAQEHMWFLESYLGKLQGSYSEISDVVRHYNELNKAMDKIKSFKFEVEIDA